MIIHLRKIFYKDLKLKLKNNKYILKITLNRLFLLILVSLYSCTGSSEDSNKIQQVPIKEIINKVNQNSNLISSLEASGSISIDSPELSNSASFDLKLKKPDSIQVKIEGPFGIAVASALITRKNFIYYNAQENKVITGPTNEINIGAILKIKVSFDELLNSFAGSFSMNDEPNDTTYAQIENENYVILENNDVFKKKYLIEPNGYKLNSYNVYDNSNNKILAVDYSNYCVETSTTGDVNFPAKIKISKPDKSETVWLDYDSKVINKKNITFVIKVPKSAKVIKWE
jgi:hypothetical protein